MGARGKKSGAQLTAAATGTLIRLDRPAPPADLTPEEADEWRAIVERLPADWFPRETHALLIDFCRHVVFGRRVWELLQRELKKKKPDVEEIERLQRMTDRQTRVVTSLATKMRISQQTQYDKKKARGSGAGGQRPWEDDGAG